MEITVTNEEASMSAVSDRGRALSIAVGPQKPPDDTSMSPSELFITSVGMCIAVLVQSYCSRAGLDCGTIQVVMTAEWEEEPSHLAKVSARVQIPGEWDKRRERAFHKVAEACPVHESIRHWEGMEIMIE